jgi:hypothetical protein
MDSTAGQVAMLEQIEFGMAAPEPEFKLEPEPPAEDGLPVDNSPDGAPNDLISTPLSNA